MPGEEANGRIHGRLWIAARLPPRVSESALSGGMRLPTGQLPFTIWPRISSVAVSTGAAGPVVDRDPNKIRALAVCLSAAADILLPMHRSFS